MQKITEFELYAKNAPKRWAKSPSQFSLQYYKIELKNRKKKRMAVMRDGKIEA